MKTARYLIAVESVNVETGAISREYGAPIYDSPRAAHEYARSAGLVSTSSGKPPKKRPHAKAVPGTEKTVCAARSTSARAEKAVAYRVYPCIDDVEGIDALARAVTRTACRLLLDNTGAANLSARELLERIFRASYADSVGDYDAQDCISAATVAIWEAVANGGREYDATRAGLKAVYRHVRGERGYLTGKGKERLLYLDGLTDADIAYFGATSYIDDIAQEVEKENGALYAAIPATLTETQARAMYLLANGLHINQIARVLDKSPSTISRHVRLACAALAGYMLDNSLQFPDGVTEDDVRAMMDNDKAAASGYARRTEAGREAAREKTRERVRAYRERKRAEKAAQKAAQAQEAAKK